MILLEIGNRILAETVSAQIILEEKEEKREPIDVRLCDFDDVSYRVVIEKDNRSVMRVSMAMPCYSAIKDNGAAEAAQKHYGSLLTDAEGGYDVTLNVNLDNLGMKPEEMINKLQLLKSNVLGGVFDFYFSNLLKGGKPGAPFSFNLRSDTTVYFVPAADRVTIIYGLDFKERVDKAVAKVFMQEFQDARRTLGAAPPVAWGVNPPSELKEFGITQPTGNLGFITFTVFKAHVEKEKKEKVVAVMQSFRTYMQYHIKCSKSYFHSRMRLRVRELLAVLNRAKADPIGDNSANKKTITGKTFTRAI